MVLWTVRPIHSPASTEHADSIDSDNDAVIVTEWDLRGQAQLASPESAPVRTLIFTDEPS
jgi:hypothetical protein